MRAFCNGGALLPLRFAAAKSSLRRRVCLGADGRVSLNSAHDGHVCWIYAAKKARGGGAHVSSRWKGKRSAACSDEGFVCMSEIKDS